MSSPIPEASRVTLDQTACIAAQSDIGQTVTHNICTGATAVVPWGSADWLGFLAVGAIALIVAGLFASLAAMVVSDLRRGF